MHVPQRSRADLGQRRRRGARPPVPAGPGSRAGAARAAGWPRPPPAGGGGRAGTPRSRRSPAAAGRSRRTPRHRPTSPRRDHPSPRRTSPGPGSGGCGTARPARRRPPVRCRSAPVARSSGHSLGLEQTLLLDPPAQRQVERIEQLTAAPVAGRRRPNPQVDGNGSGAANRSINADISSNCLRNRASAGSATIGSNSRFTISGSTTRNRLAPQPGVGRRRPGGVDDITAVTAFSPAVSQISPAGTPRSTSRATALATWSCGTKSTNDGQPDAQQRHLAAHHRAAEGVQPLRAADRTGPRVADHHRGPDRQCTETGIRGRGSRRRPWTRRRSPVRGPGVPPPLDSGRCRATKAVLTCTSFAPVAQARSSTRSVPLMFTDDIRTRSLMK